MRREWAMPREEKLIERILYYIVYLQIMLKMTFMRARPCYAIEIYKARIVNEMPTPMVPNEACQIMSKVNEHAHFSYYTMSFEEYLSAWYHLYEIVEIAETIFTGQSR